jgi:mannose-1-phosphate guanylyltransferase
MNVHVVILAGGQGTRFWPISRRARPKQFLSLGDNKETLIAATVRRVRELFTENSRLWIVTTKEQEGLVKEFLDSSELTGANVILEPCAKDTAASIALAATHIRAVDENGVVLVLPADHAVRDPEILRRCLREAIDAAVTNSLLMTVGIQPTSPNTAYGYIRLGRAISQNASYVARFYEKPSIERAKTYIKRGDYLWNSGMVAFTLPTFFEALAECLPDLNGKMAELKIGQSGYEAHLAETFRKLEAISIDFGLLEHIDNCGVIVAPDFGWSDVGSWDAWASCFSSDKDGNLSRGDTLIIDSKGLVVHSERKFTAVLGVENLVIIDAQDALLIVPRGRVQDVKEIVQELKRRDREELL